MKKSPIALAVSLVLFVGWISYLGVTALRNRRPVVVSAAQLLVSDYDVEADLEAEDDGKPREQVQVRKVLFSGDDNKPAGAIKVSNLRGVEGFGGPGAYLVPLVRKGEQYEVAGQPLDPGFPFFRELPKPRIYPLTDEVRRQHHRLRNP